MNSGTGPTATGMDERELDPGGSSGSGRSSGRGIAPLSFLLSSSEGHWAFQVDSRLNQHLLKKLAVQPTVQGGGRVLICVWMCVMCVMCEACMEHVWSMCGCVWICVWVCVMCEAYECV